MDGEGGYLDGSIQDLDGMWLEPHRDIKEKLFSMVIYLCVGPFAHDWAPTFTITTRNGAGAERRSSIQRSFSSLVRIAGTASSRVRSMASAVSWRSTT